jgi:RNA polymerase sigma-70 factor, ECF subfamily
VATFGLKFVRLCGHAVTATTSAHVSHALEALIERCLAKYTWPALPVEQFVERLAELATDIPDVAEWLAALPAEDLFLAWACGLGSPEALATFDRDTLSGARFAVVRTKLSSAIDVDEVLQALRVHLLVSSDGKPARIGSYEGIGSLEKWVQTAAIRLAISHARRLRPVAPDAEFLSELEIATGDAELDLIRMNFRKEFRAVFPQVLAALEPDDRTLLRLYFLDDVSLEAIGKLYSVHKSSISRRLSRVRGHVLVATRERMQVVLRVDEAQLDSLMRLVEGDLDLSLETFLH